MDRIVEEIQNYQVADVLVGKYLVDQLLIPISLAWGVNSGRFSLQNTPGPTLYLETITRCRDYSIPDHEESPGNRDQMCLIPGEYLEGLPKTP